MEQRVCMPQIRGLCPELQALFDLTMGAAPLPYPLRSVAVAAVAAEQPEVTRGIAGMYAWNAVCLSVCLSIYLYVAATGTCVSTPCS